MMRDVMESAGLTIFAEIGLVLMFLGFFFVVARSLTRKGDHYKELANLPLDDEEPSRDERLGSRPSEPSEV